MEEDPSDEQEEVDLHGFQVVRREFFAHVREPSIIFNDGKVGVNTACVRKLPDVEYVQILIVRLICFRLLYMIWVCLAFEKVLLQFSATAPAIIHSIIST